MTKEQILKNLALPNKKIDVVLDTDAYNEIDDQFAICYMLANTERFDLKALYAAPFHNHRSIGPLDGMEKSYNEILKILKLTKRNVDVFKGSTAFLKNSVDFEPSDAAYDLVARAENYSVENPLYVVAIGAITNVASALIFKPEIAEKLVVVWLGGHARTWEDTKEFNMRQDYNAARIVMQSVPFVQAPCNGVVSEFAISRIELEKYFYKKGNIGNYLAENVLEEVSRYTDIKGDWTRVIWDVVAVAWLLNDDNRFMISEVVNVKLPTDEGVYSEVEEDIPMVYINHINREALLDDLIKKIELLG